LTCAIDINGVSFEYSDFSLQNISMELHIGEQRAIVGPNGSGKTTLFKIIMGLLEPHKGEVLVFDRKVRPDNLWEMRQEVGFLFQNPEDQLFAPTVWEDVAFGPHNLGLSEDEVARRVEWALETVGMCDLIDRPVNQMSHGQAKRVALAGIIAMRPSILILDEPFTGLDFEMVSGIVEIVQELRQRGISVLYTTHNRFFLENWADSVTVLSQGRIIYDGSPSDALDQPYVAEKIGNWDRLRERLLSSKTMI
jgi:cobalt/nickel transport system ATP-binding protein